MSNSLFPDFSVSMNREPPWSLTELESIPRALESKLYVRKKTIFRIQVLQTASSLNLIFNKAFHVI